MDSSRKAILIAGESSSAIGISFSGTIQIKSHSASTTGRNENGTPSLVCARGSEAGDRHATGISTSAAQRGPQTVNFFGQREEQL